MPFFECREYKFDYDSCSVLCKLGGYIFNKPIIFRSILSNRFNNVFNNDRTISANTMISLIFVVNFKWHHVSLPCRLTYHYVHCVLFSLFSSIVDIYKCIRRNHCIKLTRETKTKATISLEKLIQIAAKRVLLPQPTSLFHRDTLLAILTLWFDRFYPSHYRKGSFIRIRKKRKSSQYIQWRFVMPVFSLSLGHHFYESRNIET